jgi:hypothetical protein
MVRSRIDASRLADIVSRPGIDPRVWILFATVEALGFDEVEGIFADVRYVHNGRKITAYVGSPATGDGFGDWCPLKVDQLVLVAVPNGDEENGAIVIASSWDASRRPPTEFQSEDDPTEPTGDRVIMAEPGTTLRVIATEGANIVIHASGGGSVTVSASGDSTVNVNAEKAVIIDSPDVRVGKGAGKPIARLGDMVAVTLPALASPSGPVAPVTGTPPGTAIGQIVSGSPTSKA